MVRVLCDRNLLKKNFGSLPAARQYRRPMQDGQSASWFARLLGGYAPGHGGSESLWARARASLRRDREPLNSDLHASQD
jgi:hypothetical protein